MLNLEISKKAKTENEKEAKISYIKNEEKEYIIPIENIKSTISMNTNINNKNDKNKNIIKKMNNRINTMKSLFFKVNNI
jgi:hypothetical protein